MEQAKQQESQQNSQAAQDYIDFQRIQLKIKYLSELPEKKDVDKNVIFQYIKDEFDYSDLKNTEILRHALEWKPQLQKEDIFSKQYNYPQRPLQRCSKDNGWQNHNSQMISALRSIGKQILVQIGKKILSGQLNLTQISFPIKSMIPVSALEKALRSTCVFPLYMNKAAHIDDNIERLKLVITACISNFHYNQGFGKPLNPILGETCYGEYDDGTQAYAEQISHHPPISYFLVVPKDRSYKYYGNYNYSSKAGMNSVQLINSGSRNVVFKKDGQKIAYNFAREQYGGTFMGAMKLETKGQLIFEDAVNKLKAIIDFDSSFKAKSYGDEFIGEIQQCGLKICSIRGSYITHIDFDRERYFDYRYIQPYQIKIDNNAILESDQGYRKDKNYVIQGDIEGAQIEKEKLENVQRSDAKLRKQYIQSHNLNQKYDTEEDINL